MPAAVFLAYRPALFPKGLQAAQDRLPVALGADAVLLLLHTAVGAHGQHQILHTALQGRDLLILVDDGDLARDAVDILLQVAHKGIAKVSDAGVGSGAKAHVVRELPVLEVVAALEAGGAEVRDLILAVAVAFEHLGRVRVHVRLFVIVREDRGIAVRVVHGRPLFQLQGVAGNVLRVQLHRAGQALRPVALGLARQSVHQVQGDVVKTGAARGKIGLPRLFGVVAAADHLEQVVLHRLHTDGEAVYPLLTKLAQFLEVHGVGIALHRHFGVDAHVSVQLQHVEKLQQALGPVIARRAAAEVDAVHLVVADRRRRFHQVINERAVEDGHLLFTAGQRIEIAVAAL